MATKISVKINYAQIQAKLDKAIEHSNALREAAYSNAYGMYNRAKRLMIKEFDRHPVTVEIEEGIDADNISGTLDGYGNLFSFIGFYEGEEPTIPLRELLIYNTTFRQTIYRNKSWYFKIKLPTQSEIEEVTQMPWEGGNSWAVGIERGITGLSQYMAKRWSGGRSGGGFQLPYENNEDLIFTPRPYMTEILKNFERRVGEIGENE
jgi:hypothetical protein